MNQTTNPSVFIGLTASSYVKIVISVFGMLTNLVNIIVFFSPKLNDVSYRLMMSKSVANIVYLAVAFQLEIVVNCVNCAWSGSFISVWDNIAFGIYFLSCLAVFRILIDIAISIYTYCILINKPYNRSLILVLVILFVVSLLYNLNKAFMLTSLQLPNQKYILMLTSFGLSNASQVIQIVTTVFRIFLAVVVVSLINFANVIKFSKRFKSRVFSIDSTKNTILNRDHLTSISNLVRIQSLRNSTNESVVYPNGNHNLKVAMTKNFIRMVIFSLFLNVLGQMPFSLVVIISYLGVNSYSAEYQTAYLYANFVVYLAPALDLFSYYLFNKLFRNVLNGFFNNIFHCK